MTRKEQLAFCRICLNRHMSKQGMVCKLTDAPPAFASTCTEFKLDEGTKQKRAIRDASKAYYTVEGGEAFTTTQKYKHTRIVGGIVIMLCAAFRIGTIYGVTEEFSIKYSVLFLIGVVALLVGLFKKNDSNI